MICHHGKLLGQGLVLHDVWTCSLQANRCVHYCPRG